MDIPQLLSQELHFPKASVSAAIALINEGATIPFIARYRKEATGSMDDQTLRTLFERLSYLRGMEKRRQEIRQQIESQGKLTDALSQALEQAQTLAALEDLYLPYRPKRRTRASVAREKGLAPLAQRIWEQKDTREQLLELAYGFLSEEKQV